MKKQRKRRTFISTPVPPYDVGDLWAQGKDGALLACIKKKTGSQLYSADDWTDAANYRDYPAIMEKNGLNGYTKTAQAAQPKATEYMVTAGPMSAGDKNTIKAQAEALGLPVTVKEC